MIHSLFYRSAAQHAFPHASDLEILRAAWAFNAKVGITGYLVRTQDAFFQVLEGPEGAVRALFEKIGADPRHHSVEVLQEIEAEARRFGQWAMGYAEMAVGDPAAEVILDPRGAESPELLVLAMQGMAARRGGVSGRGVALVK